jgi:hypothetical protein
MVEGSPFIGQEWTEQLETPAPRGKLWEVMANVRFPRDVEEIETLPKEGPVQHQRDHSAPPGSRTSICSTLTRQSSAVMYHIISAS